MNIDDATQWLLAASDLGDNFARDCRKLCDETRGNYTAPLEDIVSSMMTSLWDFGFSQTEIRNAFNAAIDDMPRYAAGEERR